MLKRNRKYVFIGVVLFVIAVAVSAYLIASRSYTSLETIAIKTSIPFEATCHDWVSDTEILLAIPDRQSSLLTINKFNVTSRTIQNLEGVTHKIASLPKEDGITYIESLSPDGEWLLCTGWQGRAHARYAVSMSGSSYLRFDPGSVLHDGIWFPDSRRWAAQSGFGSPVSLTTFPCNNKEAPSEYRFPVDMDMPHFMGFARNGNAVIADYWISEYYEKVVVCQYKYGTQQKIRQDTVAFPFRGVMAGMTIDPHGDRMLWQLEVEWDQTHPAWLRHVLRYLRRSKAGKSVTLFYLCGMNGSDGKIIGYVDSTEVENPHWLPSGKTMSFVVGKSLWVVPVP